MNSDSRRVCDEEVATSSIYGAAAGGIMRLATAVLVLSVSANSWAGAALDDDKKPATQPNADPAGAAAPAAATSDTPPANIAEEPVTYGIDIRLRNVRVPKGMLEWFVNHAADGASNFGYGIDFIRRRGTLELQLGLEFEHINIGEGVYIEKNKTVPGDPADYIIGPDHAPNGDNLGWVTLEFTFINNTPINKYVSFRYGGGAGLGILTGGLYRWDVACGGGATNSNPEPGCIPGDVSYLTNGTGHTSDDSNGGKETVPVKYDLPPVFPVINAIIGVQIKPFDKAVINIEGGIRTLPFIGMSFGYFLD